jgi:hypothetical protein
MVNGHLLILETAAFTHWAALVSFNMSVNFCSHAIYVCLDSRLFANHHGPLPSTHIPLGKFQLTCSFWRRSKNMAAQRSKSSLAP